MSGPYYSSQSYPPDNDSCYHNTTNPGYPVEKRRYGSRVRRIEGQTRGIDRMIENEEYCVDVLTRIPAVNSTLKSLTLAPLDAHLHHRVVHAAEGGQEELNTKLEEASVVIARLAR